MASSIEDDPRWLLVQRIVASSGFVNSNRLSTFLLYVTRHSIVGEGANLNERSIGEAVFERSHDYDPRDDNIVRSHASRLRIRLEEFFEVEGASEVLRVTIPRGSYVPQFERVELGPLIAKLQVPPSESAIPEPDAHLPIASSRVESRASKTLVVCLVIVVLGITAASAFFSQRFRLSLQRTPSHKLWSQMFRSDQETIIVPADSTLVLARLMVGHPILLPEYAGGHYRQAPDCVKPCDLNMVNTFEQFRYTSMSDLEFAVKVTHVPEAIPDRTEIRFARDLQLKDLKESNVVMAGSQEADPWLSAISGQMNFVLHDDPSAGALRVENKQPKAGEKSEYLYDSHDSQRRGLATIAFLPNLGGTGNVLVVQGFSLAGTQAAAEFITSGRDLDELFQAYSGNSTKLPHFEILLATVEINGMATHAVPLAWHVHP